MFLEKNKSNREKRRKKKGKHRKERGEDNHFNFPNVDNQNYLKNQGILFEMEIINLIVPNYKSMYIIHEMILIHQLGIFQKTKSK